MSTVGSLVERSVPAINVSQAAPGIVVSPAISAAITSNDLRYARYFGKEAGVFSRNNLTPFEELFSSGVIPDESLLTTEVGWFQLVEATT